MKKLLILMIAVLLNWSCGENTVDTSKDNNNTQVDNGTVVCTVYMEIIQNIYTPQIEGCSTMLVEASQSFTSWSYFMTEPQQFVTFPVNGGSGTCGPYPVATSTFDVHVKVTWTNSPSFHWGGKFVYGNNNYFLGTYEGSGTYSREMWLNNVNLNPSTAYNWQIGLEYVEGDQ